MWMSVPFASYLTCEILCSLAHSVHDQCQVRVLSASCFNNLKQCKVFHLN